MVDVSGDNERDEDEDEEGKEGKVRYTVYISDAPIWLKTDIPIFRFFITDICRYR